MKTSFLHRKPKSFPARNRAGMTLVEVVIALGITALTVGGIVSGYIYSSNTAIKDSLQMAACTQAQARLEQARSAQWDVSAYPVVDQLVATNFPDLVVTLNQPDSQSGPVSATVRTTISQVSLTPPVRLIHVDCTWLSGTNSMTTSIETMRAPDE